MRDESVSTVGALMTIIFVAIKLHSAVVASFVASIDASTELIFLFVVPIIAFWIHICIDGTDRVWPMHVLSRALAYLR